MLQLIQQQIVEIASGRALHREVKVGLVAFQSVVERELTDAEQLQLLVFDAFLPSLAAVVIEQPNAKQFPGSASNESLSPQGLKQIQPKLTCIPRLSRCLLGKFQPKRRVRGRWS